MHKTCISSQTLNHIMESLFILIPITLLLVGVAIAVFFWAMRSGQFDDLDSPAWRILGDDEDRPRR